MDFLVNAGKFTFKFQVALFKALFDHSSYALTRNIENLTML